MISAVDSIYITLLEFSILVTVAQVISITLAKYKSPKIIGELLTGIILSPYAIGGLLNEILHINIFEINDYVIFLSEFSVILLLFASGLEHGLSSLRQGGFVSLIAAVAGAVAPYLMVLELLGMLSVNGVEASIIAASTAPTSLAVVAGVIESEGFVNLPSTKVLIASASMDDVVALIILSLTLSMLGGSTEQPLLIVLKITATWALFLLLSIIIIPRLLNRINEYLVIYASLIVLFGLVTAMTLLGFSAVIASFIAGVAVAESIKSSRVKASVDALLAIFGSLFFITIGLQINPRSILNLNILIESLEVSSVAVLAKITGVYPFAYIKLRNLGEALTVALGMVPRGEMGLVVASIGYANGLIGSSQLSLIVLMVLITTVVGALTYKASAQRYG